MILIVAVGRRLGGKPGACGYVTLGKGALKPGLGVSKELQFGGGYLHHRNCGKLRQLRSPYAAKRQAVRSHADGGLHQRKHHVLSKSSGITQPLFDKFLIEPVL